MLLSVLLSQNHREICCQWCNYGRKKFYNIGLSTPIAWLFAQPVQGAENGFSVTGGIFNYTAEIKFPDTQHSAQVKIVFKVSQGCSRYIVNDVDATKSSS